MDNMLDMRKRMDDGTYDLTLLIGDNTYFNFYESINTDAAKDVVRNYLFDNDDDADYKNVTIDHNKNRHIVTINAKLDYINGEHKDYNYRGTYPEGDLNRFVSTGYYEVAATVTGVPHYGDDMDETRLLEVIRYGTDGKYIIQDNKQM